MAKQINCKRCSFMIRSEDENELVSVIQQHNSSKHDWETSREDILKATKDV